MRVAKVLNFGQDSNANHFRCFQALVSPEVRPLVCVLGSGEQHEYRESFIKNDTGAYSCCCQQSDSYPSQSHGPHVGKGAAGEHHSKCRHTS